MKNKSLLNNEIHATLNPNMKVYANPFPEKMAEAVAFLTENGLPSTWEQPETPKKSPSSTPSNPFPAQMTAMVAALEQHETAVKAYINERTEKRKAARSKLQNELLNIYTFDPTEQQLQQLKAFMAQLFADKLQAIKAEEQEEITA
jgi:hypothetical protein